VKYSSMMTLHVSSQSASERNASHARAPSSPPGTRFAALLMLLMFTNKHCLYFTSTFSDRHKQFDTHSLVQICLMYTWLTDDVIDTHTLVSKHIQQTDSSMA